MKVILLNVDPIDLQLACRAAQWLMGQLQKDAILCYGDSVSGTKDFYVKRNKASITVRPIDA